MLLGNCRVCDQASSHKLSSLSNVAMGGFKKVVRMLLDAGADVNDGEAGYSNVLHEASKNSDEETVRMLLDAGAIVDTELERMAMH
jgi:ankyrin repeat protein